jgi:hypothetical protein
MTPADPSPPAATFGRLHEHEDRSQIELATTEVSPAVARTMSLAFVLLVILIPAVQSGLELARNGRVQALDVFHQLPSRAALRAYEQALESASAFKAWVQPRVQQALTAGAGAGTDRVVLGRDEWLFYQPGLDFVTGAGLLDPALLRVRAGRMSDREHIDRPQPDPRPALRALRQDLAAAGIGLVLVPVPDKAMYEGRYLVGPPASGAPAPVALANRDWPRLVAGLRGEGFDVFDVPAPDGPGPAFLSRDTHWTPPYMQQVARALARHVPAVAASPPDRDWRTEAVAVSHVGDLVDMLHLPVGQRTFAPQTVTIERVLEEDATSWKSRPDADVLLLGDSFTNIYSDGTMGWGDAAGFAEHLSLALGRPLDVVAENGGGASALRTSLSRLAPSRLMSKRVVIYQFAVRDLVGQHWPVVRLALGEARGPAGAPDPDELEIDGTIVQTSRIPDPVTAPYASCVAVVRVRVDRVRRGRSETNEVIVGLLVMRNRMLLPPAQFTGGDRLRLRLVPFERADRATRSLQRSDDVQAFELPMFWAREAERP